jgi:hypothetical protein
MRMESHTEVEYKAADEAMDAYYEITGGDPEKNGGSAGCGARADLGRFLYPSDTTKKKMSLHYS